MFSNKFHYALLKITTYRNEINLKKIFLKGIRLFGTKRLFIEIIESIHNFLQKKIVASSQSTRNIPEISLKFKFLSSNLEHSVRKILVCRFLPKILIFDVTHIKNIFTYRKCSIIQVTL